LPILNSFLLLAFELKSWSGTQAALVLSRSQFGNRSPRGMPLPFLVAAALRKGESEGLCARTCRTSRRQKAVRHLQLPQPPRYPEPNEAERQKPRSCAAFPHRDAQNHDSAPDSEMSLRPFYVMPTSACILGLNASDGMHLPHSRSLCSDDSDMLPVVHEPT
jgi:hypothetical protein